MDFKIIEILISATEKESDRYWTRNGIFISLLVGGIALIGALSDKMSLFYSNLLAISGILISCVWIQVLRQSKYYAERWREDLRECINDNKQAKKYIRALTNPRISRPKGPSSSKSILLLSIISLIFWIAIIFHLNIS